MNLGKTLVGGIIGAAIAIAIYTVLKTQMLLDATWFPVVTGLLTGLGVRQAHKTLTNNVSYLRGAVAGVIAALAILGAEEVVKLALTTEAAKTIAQAPPVADAEDDEAESDGEAVEEPIIAEEPVDAMPRGMGGERSAVKPTRDDMWPSIFMAVGIFLAYELARGSAGPTVAATPAADEPPAGESPASEPPPEPAAETAAAEPPRDDQANA